MNNYLEENSTLTLNPTIEEGSTGEYVIILQDKLKILEYYFASITGSFDEYTKMAVMQFQRDNNLDVTGIVDGNTWKVLYALTSRSEEDFNERQTTKPVLRLGSTGTFVTELQNTLKTLLYYNGPINGNFDANTEAAVKTFQVNNRLTPDGIVGRDTWSALSTLYAPLAICDDSDNNNGNETTTYIVVAGDSLWSIAQRFNTTVDAIKRLNNLTSNNLRIGQQLLIPSNN